MENNKLKENDELKVDEEIKELLGTEAASSGTRLVWFLLGIGLFCGGAFLVTQNTILSSKFTLMDIIGVNPPFGLVILPLIIGIGVLFFNEKSIVGWILTILGLITIFLGILMGLNIFFKPVSLYEGILMFGLIAAGIGLVFKAIANSK
ncbi:MAG: hypothetical protein ACM3KR_03105 [Deltaproteobacteria bacterium]